MRHALEDCGVEPPEFRAWLLKQLFGTADWMRNKPGDMPATADRPAARITRDRNPAPGDRGRCAGDVWSWRACSSRTRRARGRRSSLCAGAREELAAGADRTSQALITQMTSIATVQNNQIDGFSRQLAELTAANERRLQELRETVDLKLREATDDARQGREETAGP